MFVDLWNPVGSDPINVGKVRWWSPMGGSLYPTRVRDVVGGVDGVPSTSVAVSKNAGYPTFFTGGVSLKVPTTETLRTTFTITGWFFPISFGGGDFAFNVVFCWGGSAGSLCTVATNSGGSAFIFTGNETSGPSGVSMGITLATNVWQHVAFRRTGNGGSYDCWLNGTIGTTQTAGTLSGTAPSLYLASRQDVNQTMNGVVGTHALWSRSLSTEEIQADYKFGLMQFRQDLRWSERRTVAFVSSTPPVSTGKNLLLLGVG